MNQTLYTPLVGINQYPDPKLRLVGCKQDIEVVEQYLKARVAQDGY